MRILRAVRRAADMMSGKVASLEGGQ
jgi:hypothetical protein